MVVLAPLPEYIGNYKTIDCYIKQFVHRLNEYKSSNGFAGSCAEITLKTTKFINKNLISCPIQLHLCLPVMAI